MHVKLVLEKERFKLKKERKVFFPFLSILLYYLKVLNRQV